MYVILVYDINLENKEGQKVLRNVFKTCKKYLVHIQNSVFEGELLDSQAIKLKSELDRYIREDKDSVILFKSRSSRWLEKEFLGKIEDDKTMYYNETESLIWRIFNCVYFSARQEEKYVKNFEINSSLVKSVEVE